jgi:ribulose kinase
LSKHFNKEEDFYKQVQFDANLWSGLSLSERKFFSKGVPEDLVDYNVALSEFKSFESAYHQLMADLTGLAKASIDLVIPENDDIDALYVSGGFARSELFVQMLAKMYPQKKVYTTEMGNATALGAALMVYGAMGRTYHPGINLGISQI